MLKIVFDTNVLLSAALSTKGSSYKLVEMASLKIDGYTSKTLMEELKKVMQRDYDYSIERAEQLIDVLLQFLKLVEPNIKIDVAKDSDDNKVIECAVYAGANYIASWDLHLTKLKEFDEIRILTPNEILRELKEVHGIE